MFDRSPELTSPIKRKPQRGHRIAAKPKPLPRTR